MLRHESNLRNIAIVATRLSELDVQFAFTGGAVLGMLLTDTAYGDVRPTDDVDVIVGVTLYSRYALLQNKLRSIGFSHDMHGPNCRFILDGIIVDVMPIEENVLGFSNRWYKHALESAKQLPLLDGQLVSVVAAPAFIATKIEAFYGRGKGDFVLSHDLEDIVALVDGRPELFDEIYNAESTIRQFICSSFNNLLQDNDFIESVKMGLLSDEASQARAEIIIQRMRRIATC